MHKSTCWWRKCTHPADKWGMCIKHHDRWMKRYPRQSSRFHGIKDVERFALYVDKDPNGGCHLWMGALNDSGYGIFNPSEDGAPSRLAHRYACHLAGRDMTQEPVLDHLCRMRPCVNPDHLEAVTHKANVGRGLAAERTLGSVCGAGHSLTGENRIEERRSDDRMAVRCRTCVNAKARENHASRMGGVDQRRSDETCRKGHPRTEESTVMRGGKRRCRICLNDASKASYHRKNNLKG